MVSHKGVHISTRNKGTINSEHLGIHGRVGISGKSISLLKKIRPHEAYEGIGQ